jgi:hypothetical protein
LAKITFIGLIKNFHKKSPEILQGFFYSYDTVILCLKKHPYQTTERTSADFVMDDVLQKEPA